MPTGTLTYAKALQALVADGLTADAAAAYIDALAEADGMRPPLARVPRDWVWRALRGRRQAGVSRTVFPTAA